MGMVIERHDSGNITIIHNDRIFFAHLIDGEVYLLIRINSDGYSYIGKYKDEEDIKKAIDMYTDTEKDL